MFRDIVYYGWCSVRKEVLFEDCTFEEASIKETELTLKHKSNYFEFGYNQTPGMRGYKRSEKIKKQISDHMPNKRGVEQLDEYGEVVGKYISIREAFRQTKMSPNNISRACNTGHSTKGTWWRYSV